MVNKEKKATEVVDVGAKFALPSFMFSDVNITSTLNYLNSGAKHIINVNDIVSSEQFEGWDVYFAEDIDLATNAKGEAVVKENIKLATGKETLFDKVNKVEDFDNEEDSKANKKKKSSFVEYSNDQSTVDVDGNMSSAFSKKNNFQENRAFGNGNADNFSPNSSPFGSFSPNSNSFGYNGNGNSTFFGHNNSRPNAIEIPITINPVISVEPLMQSNPFAQNAYNQGGFGQNSNFNAYNQNAFGQNSYNQNAFGQNSYNQNAFGHNNVFHMPPSMQNNQVGSGFQQNAFQPNVPNGFLNQFNNTQGLQPYNSYNAYNNNQAMPFNPMQNTPYNQQNSAYNQQNYAYQPNSTDGQFYSSYNEQPNSFNQQPSSFNQQASSFNQQAGSFNQQPSSFNQQVGSYSQQGGYGGSEMQFTSGYNANGVNSNYEYTPNRVFDETEPIIDANYVSVALGDLHSSLSDEEKARILAERIVRSANKSSQGVTKNDNGETVIILGGETQNGNSNLNEQVSLPNEKASSHSEQPNIYKEEKYSNKQTQNHNDDFFNETSSSFNEEASSSNEKPSSFNEQPNIYKEEKYNKQTQNHNDDFFNETSSSFNEKASSSNEKGSSFKQSGGLFDEEDFFADKTEQRPKQKEYDFFDDEYSQLNRTNDLSKDEFSHESRMPSGIEVNRMFMEGNTSGLVSVKDSQVSSSVEKIKDFFKGVFSKFTKNAQSKNLELDDNNSRENDFSSLISVYDYLYKK